MADEKERPAGNDFVVFGPDLGDGTRPVIRHNSDHSIDAGIGRPTKDGVPLGENDVVLTLKKRGEGEVYDVVETLHDNRACKGPAKVATPAYRHGWDAIFGGKKTVGQA